MPDGSADAVVADPPAGIGFMGSKWDSFGGRYNGNAARDRAAAHQGPGAGNGNQPFAYSGSALPKAGERAAFLAFLTPIMAECLRVLKPGGYALVWALPRTSHWTATALEDAGFEIRDVITHLFGQGFPKGKGCLKPAAEHWILCRHPAPRVLPLNIDECRVGYGGKSPEEVRREAGSPGHHGGPETRGAYNRGWADDSTDRIEFHPAGRWPANLCLSHHESCVCRGTKRVPGNWRKDKGELHGSVYGNGRGPSGPGGPRGIAGPDGAEEVEDWACHPECAVRLLDEQAGHLHARGNQGPSKAGGGLYGLPACTNHFGAGDAGNASRFFYVAKADRADRGEGNDHATVKPTALMSWLVKLVTRPGETVLDPFCGSGSTGVAALRCERRFVGVERDAHYHAIALKRLAAVDGPLFALPAGEAAP
jgi:DNA modification methylase